MHFITDAVYLNITVDEVAPLVADPPCPNFTHFQSPPFANLHLYITHFDGILESFPAFCTLPCPPLAPLVGADSPAKPSPSFTPSLLPLPSPLPLLPPSPPTGMLRKSAPCLKSVVRADLHQTKENNSKAHCCAVLQ